MNGRIFIALGSNLGSRRAMIVNAAAAVAALPSTSVVQASSIIETAPVGPPGQGPYLNAVIEVSTDLAPRELLEALLEIERSLGRDRSIEQRWGARLIDLDIILWNDQIIAEPGLTVPHPSMHERAFVLQPLAEIAPDAEHPVMRRTAAQLLALLSR